jgi:flagellar biosynthetic protein FliO
MLFTNSISSAAAFTNAAVGSGLPDSSATVGSLFRLLGALAIVFAILFAGVWLFRNWQRVATKNGHGVGLRVLEAKSLGQRQAIYVVACGEQRFLLGGSPAGIVMLSNLPTVPEPAPLPAESPSAKPVPAPPSFAEALARVISRPT